MSRVGIVILNYNDYQTTSKLLNKIHNYKYINNIIVVDNNSSDNSYNKLIKYKNKNIDIIKTDNNKGYSYGNNIGIKYLIDNYKSDYIIISNPDVSFEDNDIKELISKLDNNKDIALIGPKVHEFNQVTRGWKLPTYLDEILKIMSLDNKFRHDRYDDTCYKSDLTKVDVVSGCFFIIRTKIIKEINYFDEGTFLYYEENILGHKLKDRGYHTYIDNTVSVIHNASISVDKSIKKINKYKILIKSLMYYEYKYNKRRLSMIPLYIIYYICLLLINIKYRLIHRKSK